MAARLGGDEFAILLTAMTDQQSVGVAAPQLVRTLALPIQVGEHHIVCAASVGVATTAGCAPSDP